MAALGSVAVSAFAQQPATQPKPEEIAEGRRQTVEALCDILHKTGKTPVELVGRWGTKLTEEQIIQLRDWMKALKVSVN